MPLASLDTADYVPLEVDFYRLLAAAETITASTVTVPATAAAAGVSVDAVTNPVNIKNSTSGAASAVVQWWPLVNVSNQEDNAFSSGLEVSFEVHITTSSGREIERHVPVTFTRALALTEA
jgi:hypothetical protein